MKQPLAAVFGTLLMLWFAPAAFAVDATASRVIDGDTLDILMDGHVLRVRISDIDTPERRQPGGAAATQALEALVTGRTLDVTVIGADRYGRIVATLGVGGRDVGETLVGAGHAWASARDNARLQQLEADARAGGRGLWATAGAVEPAAWRKRQSQAVRPLKCGKKPRCARLRSCDEAKWQLANCGATHLDRDGDGVPCEALCR